MGIKMIII